MMASEESLQMWRNYWSSGNSRWHMQNTNSILSRHLKDVTSGLDQSGLVFVPLSGKSRDLKYVYEQGWRVLGVEFCEEVIREFFSENGIDFECAPKENFGKVYSTRDGRLKVLCGDILGLTADVIGEHVDVIWDRAAVVAIENEDLLRYSQVMTNIVKPGGKYLLVALHYDQWSHSGPPYDVSPDMIHKLFGVSFDIKLLETVSEGDSLKQYLAVPDKELVYLLTSKQL